mmetsp:Transcript_57871/g.167701  ORF Transcript_57871/g.167701 Transcript_57871/m.167701 type:complete len:221 (+) Transcript_57871:665-1327(+)
MHDSWLHFAARHTAIVAPEVRIAPTCPHRCQLSACAGPGLGRAGRPARSPAANAPRHWHDFAGKARAARGRPRWGWKRPRRRGVLGVVKASPLRRRRLALQSEAALVNAPKELRADSGVDLGVNPVALLVLNSFEGVESPRATGRLDAPTNGAIMSPRGTASDVVQPSHHSPTLGRSGVDRLHPHVPTGHRRNARAGVATRRRGLGICGPRLGLTLGRRL